MILENIKVEYTDNKTGLVVKKIKTSEWESFNHKMAVNNALITGEQRRLNNNKTTLISPFQIFHIPFIKKKNIWDFDNIAESKAHAKKQNRFFLAFQQRNDKQWKTLTFSEAEVDFQDLATRGLTLVPYSIPKNSSLEEWKKRKEKVLSILNKSQVLVPIFCSKHQIDLFEDIFNYEFENSKLIGVQCYGLNGADTIINLTKIKLRNSMLQTGDNAPLLLGLSYGKVQSSFSNVSGSFAYACYSFDILSERQTFLENMPTEVVKGIINKSVAEIMKYDRNLGGFNLSAEQEFYNGANITEDFLRNVSVIEQLTPYQAIQWANFKGQQEDFNILNNKILETANEENTAINFIESEKERWSVFWKTRIMPLSQEK